MEAIAACRQYRGRVPYHGPVTPDCPVECCLALGWWDTLVPMLYVSDAGERT
jgi:hypothetical protein